MKLEGKQMEYLKTFLLIAIIFVIVVMLNKFGLLKFGKSKDEKKADKLFFAPQLSPQFNTTILSALRKKYGRTNFTNAEFAKFAPSPYQLKKWYESILTAKSLRDDNEAQVYATFKEMPNQLAVFAFGMYFNKAFNGDLITFLSFLDSEELAKVSDIINSKPIV